MMAENEQQVSVLIPTVLRETLPRAIASVRAQQGVQRPEIVVVVDAAKEAAAECPQLLEGADRVEFTGGGAGGATARNLAAAIASHEIVAFLDDDDEWHPNKLNLQLAALANADGDNVIVATRVVQRVPGRPEPSSAVPAELLVPQQQIEDYLFNARQPSLGRAGIWTSCLLMPRDLVRKVQWNSALKRHQDWDLLIRMQREDGFELIHLSEPLVTIWVGSSGSISASSDWQTSLDWARTWRGTWTDQTYVDFIAGQTFRYAATARSWQGMKASVQEILSTGLVPNVGPVQIGLAGLIPRQAAMRMTHALFAWNSNKATMS